MRDGSALRYILNYFYLTIAGDSLMLIIFHLFYGCRIAWGYWMELILMFVCQKIISEDIEQEKVRLLRKF